MNQFICGCGAAVCQSLWHLAECKSNRGECGTGSTCFSKRDFEGVIAMMTTAICMDQLQIGEVICPVLYEALAIS